jgi:VanZ family protein
VTILQLTWIKTLIRIFWALCLTVIIIMSLLPPSEVEGTLPYNDKLLHVAAYAALGFLTFLAAPESGKRRLWLLSVYTVLFCTAVGLAIELIQPLTGRSLEVLDLAADSGGAILGLLAALLVRIIDHH